MSATKHHHHDTIEAANCQPNPRQIDDICRHLRSLNLLIEGKYQELSEAQRRRIAKMPLETPIWQLRRELTELNDQFDLALAEWDRRKI